MSDRSANLIQRSEVCDCCVTPGDIPFNLEEAHTLTRSLGCLDVISGSSGEGERSRDTASVNKQHPMATAMATHTATHTHTWFEMCVNVAHVPSSPSSSEAILPEV